MSNIISDVALARLFGYPPETTQVFRVSSDCAYLSPREPFLSGMLAFRDFWIASVRPCGTINMAHACPPGAIDCFRNLRVALALAGAHIPDLRGEFVEYVRRTGHPGARFVMPTPCGAPVSVACDGLKFAPDGRIENVFVSPDDIDMSEPNELEKALLLAAIGGSPSAARPSRMLLELYRLRGGDPESRFAGKFLYVAGVGEP